MEIELDESRIIEAGKKGTDAFVTLFRDVILNAIGGELTPENMPKLNSDQITLLAYMIYREEVMDGGHVQLIHNGYGPFIFLNPFAKAMRLWGAKDFANLVYDGRRFYEAHHEEITRDCSDEEFMAMFENYPEADDLDDKFISMEEEVTDFVADYIDYHIINFVAVV